MVDDRSVAEKRRGLKRVVRKKSWLGLLCNPQVLKLIVEAARFIFELIRLFLRN
jgi:hypothetical protein